MGEWISLLLAGGILLYSFRIIYARIRQRKSACQHCALAAVCKRKRDSDS